MKHKLLLLGASLMVSMSLSAQSFTANRTKMVPEFTNWAMEEYCYLYNVGAQAFYTNHQGERVAPYWGTRAVVNDELGQQVMFSRTNPGGQVEDWETEGVSENTCLLTSYVSHNDFKNFYCTFAEAWNGIWTDNNGNQYRYFNVIVKSNGYINIERNLLLANGGVEHEGKYFGILPTDADKTVLLHDTEEYINEETEEPYYNIDPSVEFWEDWAIVSVDAYDAWVANGGQEAAKAYAAAASLKAALEKAYAENEGINLDEPLGVYNNMSATSEELQAAEASIPSIIIEFLKNQDVSPDNPIDFTSSIKNNTFDVIGDFSGWLFGEGTNQFGAGGTTAPGAEVWRGSFDGYQELVGLPEGVYMLSCNGYCRYNDNHVDDYNHWKEGNLSNAKLYLISPANGTFTSPIKHISEGGTVDYTLAGAGNNVTLDDGSTLYTPNSMFEADAFFHEVDADNNPTNRYLNKVYGAIADGETVRIGVKNTITSDWNIFDDFQLFYYGAKPEAYQYWGQKAAENSEVGFDECWYGTPDKDAYDAAKAALVASSDKDAVIANITALEEATNNVIASKANYAAFIKAYNDAMDWLTQAEEDGIIGPDVDFLADYLQADAGDVDEGTYPNGVVRDFVNPEEPSAGTLSAEEIAAETQYLIELKATAIRNGLVVDSDLTSLIINPKFEEPLASNGWANGWSLDTHNGAATNGLTNWRGGSNLNYCAEAYQQKFDVYQVIENVPEGLYEVSVQAYYRTGTNEDAYAAYLQDPEMVGPAKVYTYVYFNDFATPVKNSMEILYNEDLANNCVNVGSDDEGNPLWCLNGMASASAAFSMTDESMNFTQKVYGLVTDGTIRLGIRNLENDGGYTWSLWDNFKLKYKAKDPEALKSVIESYTLKASEISDEYGVPESTALETAIGNASTAKTGDELYDALLELVGAYNDALTSVDLYKKADQALQDLITALEEYSETANPDVVEAASEVYSEVADGIEMRTYSNEELEGVIDKLESATSALKVPDYSDASDDNPIDFTSMIVNPSYDDATDDGWAGSTKSHSGFNRQDMNEYYYAAFDHFQVLKNLPAGTYELTLNCFNRILGNNAQQDLDYFEAGQKLEKMAAFVYATVGDKTYAEPFRMVSEAKRTEWNLDGTYNEITSSIDLDDSNNQVHYFTPNNMVGAGAAFEEVDEFDEPLGDEKNYVVRVVFTLDETSNVTIGCKNSATDTWAIWDNWTLTYFGTDSEKNDSGDATSVLSIENNVSVVASEIFTVGGARVANLQRGVNIVKTRMSDGTVKVQKVIVK